MTDSSVTPPSEPTPKTLFHRAASFCLWSPLIAIVVNMVIPQTPVHSQEEALAGVVVSSVIPLAGIVAGFFALLGIRKHGRSGLLWKSVIGLLIWTLLAASAISAFQTVREHARKSQEQRTETGVCDAGLNV
jgi:hypothetical protein